MVRPNLWKLVNVKTGEVKITGSFRSCSLVWEGLESDDWKMIQIYPIRKTA